jgi:hypothetical protein
MAKRLTGETVAELRIVSEELWSAAQARLDQRSHVSMGTEVSAEEGV